MQRMGRRTQVLPVDHGEHFAFDVGNKIPGRAARDDRHLVAGTTDGRERLDQRQFAPGVVR